jgi:hypothetical protein
MRRWNRLIEWAAEEREAAEFYTRLAQAAAWHDKGAAGLWRNPELEFAEQWHRETQPSPAWAARYDESFDRAMEFLSKSRQEREEFLARVERERKAKLRRTEIAAAVLAIFLVVAASLAYVARRESARAAANLELARAAVDESLASADRDPARAAADDPQLEEFRRELLAKAQQFYVAFMNQEPTSEQSRRDLAFAHFRLAHIHRIVEKPDDAVREYQNAIARFAALMNDYPEQPAYRQALANAYNWLGETLRPRAGRATDAQRAYEGALNLQRALVQAHPQNAEYRRELARTLYNRGILRWNSPNEVAAAEPDFREAVRLLDSLASTSDEAAQEMSRAYNNLAGLLALDPNRVNDAPPLYERAIATHERLLEKEPANREYKLELAKFCNNLASLLHEQGHTGLASRRSSQALGLIESLSRLPPSLAVERADAHNLRGLILQTQDSAAALQALEEALDLFGQMLNDPDLHRLPDFHLRFGDLLLSLAAFPGTGPDAGAAARLLSRGVALYANTGAAVLQSASRAEAQTVLDTISRVLPHLPTPERDSLTTLSERLRRMLETAGPPDTDIVPNGRR